MEKFTAAVQRTLASRWFYASVLAVFVLEASWIALTARYPMAFDENYHFGLIQLYSHQLSPFFSREPAGASIYGDVTRYPSYLYHYLMSFPYRWITHLTHNTADQIVGLRFINIALFGWAIVIWRKTLRAAGTSPALTNAILAVFVLIPQVPFLAAQSNYDNLLAPLIALCLLLSLRILTVWQSQQLDVFSLVWLLTICLLASIVMYSFLPIFAALIVYFGVTFIRNGRGWLAQFGSGWRAIKLSAKLPLLLLFLIAAGLFIERYGVNILRFHELVPDCGKVIGTQACLNYSPWARNYYYLLARQEVPLFKKLGFVFYWLYRMFYQLFFVLNPSYATTATYPIPVIISTLASVFGLSLLISKWRKIRVDCPGIGLLASVIGIYSLALFLLDLVQYVHFSVPVAIQGRYVIPLLPIIFLLIASALGTVIRSSQNRAVAIAVVIILLLQGGGVLTWIGRTDQSYWWPKSAVVSASQTAQKIVRPLLIP